MTTQIDNRISNSAQQSAILASDGSTVAESTSTTVPTQNTAINANIKVMLNGLWHNNQALVAMLGLCPLLAVSNNLVNSLGMGLATLFVVTVSNGVIAAVARFTPPEVRIPIFVTIIASCVSIIDLLLQAYLPQLHASLGIFIPLIVTNCLILARAESFARKNTLSSSILDGLAMGIGFCLVIVALGATREILGTGTLLSDAHILFGSIAKDWKISVFDASRGALLIVLPPGAFIVLGLFCALKNVLQPAP